MPRTKHPKRTAIKRTRTRAKNKKKSDCPDCNGRGVKVKYKYKDGWHHEEYLRCTTCRKSKDTQRPN